MKFSSLDNKKVTKPTEVRMNQNPNLSFYSIQSVVRNVEFILKLKHRFHCF